MNWLSGLELAINFLLSLLAQIKPGTASADAKVASEISSAIERLKAARQQTLDLAELESLRTKPLW